MFLLLPPNFQTAHANFQLIELGYDDCEPDGGVSDLANRTYGWGVLFNHPAPGWPFLVVYVKLYIYDIRGTGGLLRIFIYDYAPNIGKYVKVFEVVEGNLSTGWNQIDFKENRVFVKQDFIIGVNWAKNYTLFLGDDYDTRCHSGGFNTTRTTNFEHFDERNFMIRVILEKSVVASIKVAPCELNLRSKGNWITVGINLPEDLELSEVVLDSIRINGTLQVELHPLRYNNKNNSYELMIKLRRAAIEDFLLRALPTGKASFILTGFFSDGKVFYGELQMKMHS